MWLRKRGDGKKKFKDHTTREEGDERSFGENVSQEMISSDYVEKRRNDSLTMRFREEVMEKQPFSNSEGLIKDKK
jgi:hypothetical protein